MPARVMPCLIAALLLASAPALAAGPSAPVRSPPPKMKYEPRPVAPDESSVWIPGDWRRIGGTWVWARGRYAEQPAPGYRWTRGAWQQRTSGWVYQPGGWTVVEEADPFAIDSLE